MHRGGLQESMETMKDCKTIKEIVEYLESGNIDVDLVKCKLYCDEADERIGWLKTYIVMGNFKGFPKSNKDYPLAFCDDYFTIRGYNQKEPK